MVIKMMIRTIEETYNVIRAVEGNQEITAYLCTCEGKPKEGNFLVMKPNRQELSKKMLTYFMDLKKGEQKDDFIECFTKESVVWVAFRHYEGTPFAEKLRENLSVEERLSIGKNLVEHFLFQKLPEYLRYEAFKLENLVVDDSLAVHTNYLLLEPDEMESCSIQKVLKKIAVCFKRLFDGELEEDMSPELYEFVKKMYRSEYPDEASVYRAYRDLDAVLWQEHGEGKLKGKGYLTKVWERISGHFVGAYKLLYAAVVMGLIGILVYVCIMPKTAPADRMLFQNIGTLTLIENKIPSLDEKTGIPETEQEKPADEDSRQPDEIIDTGQPMNTEQSLPEETETGLQEAEMG